MSGQLYLSEVALGQQLPPLIKRPTARQLVMYAGASGDFYEVHYDQDFARTQGLPGVILHGAIKSAFLAQLVTDWIGPEGLLESFSVRYREMDVPGDTLTCRGTVVEKSEEAGTVRCDLWIENGTGVTTTTGEAVVALPPRR